MDKNEFIDELNYILKNKQIPISEKLFEDTFIDIYKNPIVEFELKHLNYEELNINNKKIIINNTLPIIKHDKPACGQYMVRYFFTNKIVIKTLNTTIHSLFNYIQNKYNIKFNGNTFIFTSDNVNIYPTQNAYINNMIEFYKKIHKNNTYMGLHFVFSELLFNKYYNSIQNLILYQINNISKHTNMFIHIIFDNNKLTNLIYALRYVFKKVIILFILSPLTPNYRVNILCIDKLNNINVNIIDKISYNSKQYNNIVLQIMKQLQQNINNSILFVNEWIKLHKIQQHSILYKIGSYTKYY